MQIKENSVPKDTKVFIEDFKEKILKGIVSDKDLDKVITSILTKDSTITNKPVTEIDDAINDFCKRFEKDGLSREQYTKAIIKQPNIISVSNNTLENNIRNVVKKFTEEGLTTEDYIKAAVNQPPLFFQSADTIENNVRTFVKKFQNKGLTIHSYLKAALKQPQLFSQSADTIEKNILQLVKRFKDEGLTIPDFLEVAIKQPQLFYKSPDNAERKINLYIFREECEAAAKNKQPAKKEIKKYLNYTNLSEEKIMLRLLNTLIFNSLNETKIKENNLAKEMPKYLQNHQDRSYNLQILDREYTQDFINFAHRYSENILGKNVFNIEIINNDY